MYAHPTTATAVNIVATERMYLAFMIQATAVAASNFSTPTEIQ